MEALATMRSIYLDAASAALTCFRLFPSLSAHPQLRGACPRSLCRSYCLFMLGRVGGSAFGEFPSIAVSCR